MSLIETRNKVSEVLSELDVLINQTDSQVIQVKLGDNLASLIENSSGNIIFSLPDNFIHDGSFIINKPCTIHGNILNRRVILNDNQPQIKGQLVINAPYISFLGIKVEGTNKEIKLVIGNEFAKNLTFIDSIILGSINGQRSGLGTYASGLKVVRSHIGNIWYQGKQCQAIGSERGGSDMYIDDCFLEASGENFMTGGGDLFREDLTPSNIEILNSHFFKPLEWKTRAGSTANLFELKAAKNVHVKNCIFENSWTDIQTGYGIVLTVRNQNNRDPYVTISNVLMEDCILKNAFNGIQILGRDDIKDKTTGIIFPSEVMNDVTIRNFKIEGLKNNGRTIAIAGGPKNLALDGINVENIEPINSFLVFDQPQFKSEGLGIRNGKFIEGQYGIFGTGAPSQGTVVLDMYAPGYVAYNNTVVKSGFRKISYPAGFTAV